MALRLFFSYSHKDQRLRDELAAHLTVLERTALVAQWYDGCITPGSRWNEAILGNLARADIILLLVSADFITSEFCWGEELQRALERAESGRARVIPVVLRPTFWTGTPLAALEALPKDRQQLKPVTRWSDRDAAWVAVVSGVYEVAQQLAAGPAVPTPVRTRGTLRGRRGSGESGSTGGERPAGERVLRGGGSRSVPAAGTLRRAVHSAANRELLPGALARKEGQAATGDAAVDEVYDALAMVHAFFLEVLQHDSIDGHGLPLVATVHYSHHYANAFWNGKQMVFGDGDGVTFARFTISPDVVAKQFANGVVARCAALDYWGQSGALFNSLATVFAVLSRQYRLGESAAQAGWLFAEGLLLGSRKGTALLSLSVPGTAYDHPVLGRDPQPAHLRDLVEGDGDNGGVHVNAGIANRAFYLAAREIGGHAWEKAGRIWYGAMRDARLPANADFAAFARLTTTVASERYGRCSAEARAVHDAWEEVGTTLDAV